jgi:hypothetical protein
LFLLAINAAFADRQFDAAAAGPASHPNIPGSDHRCAERIATGTQFLFCLLLLLALHKQQPQQVTFVL